MWNTHTASATPTSDRSDADAKPPSAMPLRIASREHGAAK